MTRTDAITGIVSVGVEIFDSHDKVETFLAKPADEQAELLAALVLAGKAPPATSKVWSAILAALSVLGTVAGDVSGVSGAVAAIRNL